MVIGLTPEYIYNAPSDYAQKLYSTNHGAAFITRSIMKIFNGDYIDINESHDFNELKNKYSSCIIATASQLGPERDLSKLVNFIEKLDIKTFFLSGGVDAGGKYCINYKLHPSIIRLLDLCTVDETWIGVRGDLSAYYLHKHGYKTAVPIGCPTIYSNGLLEHNYSLDTKITSLGVPFHWALVSAFIGKNTQYDFIGQDEFDEELFKGNISGSVVSKICKVFKMQKKEVFDGIMHSIGPNSIFPESYSDWYSIIGEKDRILSGRLHANICGLTQGIPSVLVPWDMRTYELVDYLSLPHVSWETLRSSTTKDIFEVADFDNFKTRIKKCYENWVSFNKSNGLNVSTESDVVDNKIVLNDEWQQTARVLKSISQYESDKKYDKFKTVGNWRIKEWVSDVISGREKL